MPYLTVVGERTFYALYQGDVRGERNLVLVHGAGGSHLDWPAALRRLRGANVYDPDLPGHGRSEGPGRSSIAAYRDFLLAFLDALGLERVTVVGHSMGGAIALDFALHYPDRLVSLILVGSGARLRVAPAILTGILSDFEATVGLVCDYAFGPGATEQLRRLGRQRLLKTPAEVLHGDYAACDAFDAMERLGEVRCPTLVIGGTADMLTPPKYSVYLRDHIPGAELVLVDAAGHMVMLEKPEVVSKIIFRFIALLT
ncbi:MAG: alpha/beta hydrolase [Anaerolineae bacterium]|nr:alpha/beta hydrolase [Anaerolineae bacterium]